MPVGISGQWNISALQVPGVYIDIIPPSPNITGAPTNVVGLVGVGSWGPVNSVIRVSQPADCAVKLGVPVIRTHDIAWHVWAATQIGGAAAFNCVRVTDGTDVAATGTVQTTGLTLTAKYTGSLGNTIKFVINTGTQPNTYMLSVLFNNSPPETFNNIGGTGNAFWVNAAAAINSGTAYRGPSNYIVATAGALTAAPTLATPVTLSGGTDGATGVTDTTLLGTDTAPRTGMYALRNSGIDAFALVDHSTQTNWPAIDAFALSESALACVAAASGSSISTTAGYRTTVGLDDFPTWIATGDWPSMYDSQNQVVRLVSPTAAMIGFCGNASPEQSPLNKILRGIVMTETSQVGSTYADADIQVAETSGIDLIVGPPTTAGGDYYSFITGRNAWSNTGGNGIEYTRVTNFIARSLRSFATGSIVGQLQSISASDPTRAKAKQLLDGFFAQLASPNSGSSGQGIIDTWSVVCDLTNNPPASQALGYLFATCTVRYLNTVRFFVVRLAGGGNVTVNSSSTPPTTQTLL